PRAPLSPYTTLFRSGEGLSAAVGRTDPGISRRPVCGQGGGVQGGGHGDRQAELSRHRNPPRRKELSAGPPQPAGPGRPGLGGGGAPSSFHHPFGPLCDGDGRGGADLTGCGFVSLVCIFHGTGTYIYIAVGRDMCVLDNCTGDARSGP